MDEDVSSKEEVEKLGICAGDVVAVEPRFTVTEKGYIKSRFLDDKASASVLLGIAKEVSENPGCLSRKCLAAFYGV